MLLSAVELLINNMDIVDKIANQSDRYLLVFGIITMGAFAYKTITFLVEEIKELVHKREQMLTECINNNTRVLQEHSDLLRRTIIGK